MIQDAINSAINEVLAKINGFWAGLLSPIFDSWPLYWSYGVFGLILLGCFAIGFFVPFKWVRAGLGVVVFAAGTWLLGSVMMYGKMKAKLDAARKKRR